MAVVLTLIAACGAGGEVTNPAGDGSGGPAVPTTSEPAATAATSAVTTVIVTTTEAPTTSTATSTTVASTTSTIATTTTDPGDPVLVAHQERLVGLGYWLGQVDGRFGPLTAHAVTAFQKAEGLPRTGELDEATVTRLETATTPAARSTAGTVLEIDLTRQILLVVRDGSTVRIHDVATGAAATPTPVGEYRIYSEIDGYRYAPLGTLYRPKYFNGGIALHGYTSVPSQAASHGCVRLTYPAMDDLWASGDAPVGTPVLVYAS